jgi:serine/threonine protein kinase
MAPQIKMGDAYTIKCEVWSLGVVFYKMLYNVYPWLADNIIVLFDCMKKPLDFPPGVEVSAHFK